MEYQKIINLFGNTSDQSLKFRTKSGVEVDDDARENYGANSQTKLETTMLKSSI